MVKGNPSNLPRISQLKYQDQIADEIRRVYRAGRRGEIETTDMGRFVVALQTLVNVMRDADLESRIRALEESHGR